LDAVRTIAVDSASRSSRAYAEVLFRRFLGTSPKFLTQIADPVHMLAEADAALLIGDHALIAIEERERIEAAAGPCEWFDLAHEWRARTGMPWVAAVWAVRPEALSISHITAARLIEDITQSRDHGLANIDALVREWTPRIALAPSTIHEYFTRNIHYALNED